jgi:hypothetical protein
MIQIIFSFLSHLLVPFIIEETVKIPKECCLMIDVLCYICVGQLKELGNKVLGTFGLSLDNFVCEKDPQTGGYKINFKK